MAEKLTFTLDTGDGENKDVVIDHKDYYDGPEYKGREVENVTISYKTMTARFNFEEATFVNITPK